MISNLTTFPENVLDVFEIFFGAVTGVEFVVKRNMIRTDPNGTLAICADEWVPMEEEMNGQGNFEPTLTAHNLAISHMVKMSNKETGELIHRNVAKSIREMLYGNTEMQLALRSLLEDRSDSRRTRPLRWSINGQKFASSEIDNNYVSLSVTEVTFVTETV